MRRGLEFAAVVVLLSCPSSGPSLDNFCSSYVDAVAARAAKCEGSKPDAWKIFLDGARLCTDVAQSNAAGLTQYNSDLAQPCLDIVANLPCDQLTSAGSSGELDVFCSQTLVGNVPAGGECSADRQCGLDYHCDRSALRCPGICRRLRDQNEACDPLNGVSCLPGLTCLNGGCDLPLDAGTPCAQTSDCGSGLFCDQFLMPAACAPLRSDGPCNDGENDCAPKAVCLSDGGCAVAKQEGDSCTAGAHECNLLSSCVGGMCTRWGGLNDPCGTLAPGETSNCLIGGCLYDGGSSIGVCVFLPVDAGCDTNAECGPGGACIGTPQVCHPRCEMP
jgi:hypothetical protein